jgi:hypothetical protein
VVVCSSVEVVELSLVVVLEVVAEAPLYSY